MANLYNKDYFENGEILGISGYRNYSWMPELTIKMAYNIIKYLNLPENSKILDYGCAKGYLVKAFKILDIDAYGCDISTYAIDNCDTEVKNYCRLIKGTEIPFHDHKFDYLISKDVMEHLNENELNNFLIESSNFTNKMFLVIPLGYSDNGQEKYVIESYEHDITHVLRKPKEWWDNKFDSHGWDVVSWTYKVKGIKENWTEIYDQGNIFYLLEKRSVTI